MMWSTDKARGLCTRGGARGGGGEDAPRGPPRTADTVPSPRPAAADRPSEATVKRLASQARMQQKVWDLFVPEQGIRFGDRRFLALFAAVAALHLYNDRRDAHKPPELGLPDGALRRLPDGNVPPADGSIRKEEGGAAHAHRLHVEREVEENEGVLNRGARRLRDSL